MRSFLLCLLFGPILSFVATAEIADSVSSTQLDLIIKQIKVLNTTAGREEDIITQGSPIYSQFKDLNDGTDELPNIQYVLENLKNTGEVALFVQLVYGGNALTSFRSVLPALKLIVESKVANQILCPKDKIDRNYLPNYAFYSHRFASYRTAGYLRRDDIHRQVISVLNFYSAYVKKNNQELYNDPNWRNAIGMILRKIIMSPNVSQLALERAANYSANYIPLSYEDYMMILRRVDSSTSTAYQADPAFYVVVALRDNPNPTFNNKHLYALATVAKDKEKIIDPLANYLLKRLETEMSLEDKVKATFLIYYYHQLGML